MQKKNKLKLPTPMAIKTLLYALIISLTSCGNTEYQKIVINNSEKTISILNSEFVLDSVYITKLGRPLLSIALKDKNLGSSTMNFNNLSMDYVIHVDSVKFLECSDKDLGFNIVIRRKGATVKVSKRLANNIDTHLDIQVLRGYKYLHCSKTSDTLETDGHFR